MLKNYIMIALRNMQRNKLNTAVNIVGLAIAFTCGIILFSIVRHQFSYDNFFEDKHRMFKAYNFIRDAKGEQRSPTMGYPQSHMLKYETDDVQFVTAWMNQGSGVRYNGKEQAVPVNLCDSDFFDVFSFKLLQGNTTKPLRSIATAVITTAAATTLFGNESPIGKLVEVSIDGQWKQLQIEAVCQTPPKNSSIQMGLVARIDLRSDFNEGKNEWGMQHHSIYMKLKDGVNPLQTERKISKLMPKYVAADIDDLRKQGGTADANGDIYTIKLLPMEMVHFDDQVGSYKATSKTYLYILVLIGVFVFAIACFNFVNLNVAHIVSRARELGVRKCIGATAQNVFAQLCTESFLLTVFSIVLSLLLLIITVDKLNSLYNFDIIAEQLFLPQTILFIVLAAITVSILTASYPAIVANKYSVSDMLRNRVSLQRPGVFRNLLIVIQFGIACLLICCTLVIYLQFQHMRNADLGFHQHNIISIPIQTPGMGTKVLQQFAARATGNSNIESVTGSSINIGIGNDNSQSKWQSGFDYKGKLVSATMVSVHYDYFKTLGIPLLQGREFSANYVGDTNVSVVVSQSLAQQFGEANILGTKFTVDTALPPLQIVGVVPDVYVYSVHTNKEPTMYMLSTQVGVSYIFAKVKEGDRNKMLEAVKNIYQPLEPQYSFMGSYMDDNTARWYEDEAKLTSLFITASGIAILLSCLGLFAISFIIIQQRTREIGIRKVLGASVLAITQLVTRDFLKLVALAVIIAIPVAVYVMQRWLQEYPYSIELHWWIFAIAATTAVTIAIVTIMFHSIRAALANPVKSLRTE